MSAVSTRRQRVVWRVTAVVCGAVVLASAWSTGGWAGIVDGLTGSRAATDTTAPDALGLPGRPVPILDSPHIFAADASAARYNSVPPTSGPHFPFPAATGRYDQPVPDGLTVHTLEHGHVAIQYAPDTTPEVVSRLRSLARRYPSDVLLAPYPRLPSGIALTAWGRIDLLNSYNEERIVRFVEQLRGRYDHGWRRAGG